MTEVTVRALLPPQELVEESLGIFKKSGMEGRGGVKVGGARPAAAPNRQRRPASPAVWDHQKLGSWGTVAEGLLRTWRS